MDPGGYHVRGDYIGSRGHVKLFVEGLRVEPLRSGRSSIVTADLALLNERTIEVRFATGKNGLELGGQKLRPLESHFITLPSSRITKLTLTFHAPVPPIDLVSGVLHVDGIPPENPDVATAAGFVVAFSAPERE